MELSTYLQIFKRRLLIIIVTATITLGVYLYLRPLIPVSYEASAVLRIVPYAPGDPPYTQLVYAERIMNTYVTIASSSPVLAELRHKLDLDPGRPANVEANVIPDSELLQVTVEDLDPILARDAANTIAEMLLGEIAIRDTQVYLIEPATLPAPASPLMDIIYGAIALIVGLVGGTGLAFLFENLDARLHTTEQIESVTGLPILCKIPKIRKSRQSRYHIYDPHFNHGIRSLRTILLLRDSEHPLKTILLSSALPNEGKSTITANLAISFALSERNVLLIDADMHFPTSQKFFNLNNEFGLSNYLEDPAEVSRLVQKTDIPGLSVLPSGPETPKSTELLGSDRMRTLISQLTEKYDHILIDTPAFLGIPDTAIIAPFVDVVILITKRGTIKEPALRATLQQFEQIGVQPSGLAVNYAEKGLDSSYRNYYRLIKNYDPIGDLKTADPDSDRIPEENGTSDLNDMQEDVGGLETNIDAERIKPHTGQGKDNLTEIHGIDPEIEQALNSIGIMTFTQLAKQDSEELNKRLNGKFPALRIQKNRWIEQARAICKKNRRNSDIRSSRKHD